MRSLGAMVTAALIALGLSLAPGSPARAEDPPCGSQPPALSPIIEAVPWTQQMYDPDNKIWPFSRGEGVTVAVIDSGVDATYPQLQDAVLPGYDLVRNLPAGNVDCVPHGTAVASVIAARQAEGIGFAGLAPLAIILPVRVSERTANPLDEPPPTSFLAAGIDLAVANGAGVIVVSEITYIDDPAMQDAVSRAVQAGVVVVAAVGDLHDESQDGLGPTPAAITPYPAAYDGVIGVGAVAQDGTRVPTSQIGPYVDVVAPGMAVTAAAFSGHQPYDGTGIAAGFVAATAALMLGEPGTDLAGLSGPDRVRVLTERLLATADGTPGGAPSQASGHGLVDPYRALSEGLSAQDPQQLDPRRPPPPDLAAQELAAARAAAGNSALRTTGILSVVAVAVLAVAFVIPRAKRRKWRAGRDSETSLVTEDKREEFLPGDVLFRPAAQRDSADKVDQT